MTPIIICLSSIAMLFLWIGRTVCATIKKFLEVLIEDTVKSLKWVGIILVGFLLLHILIILVTDASHLWTLIKEIGADTLRTIGQIILILLGAALVLGIINALTGGILAGLAGVIFSVVGYVAVGIFAILFGLFEKIDELSTAGFYKLLNSVDQKILDKGGEKR